MCPNVLNYIYTHKAQRRNTMTVGEKIKYYRNIRGISQEMLGNLSGINPATIKSMSMVFAIQSRINY